MTLEKRIAIVKTWPEVDSKDVIQTAIDWQEWDYLTHQEPINEGTNDSNPFIYL